MLRAPIWMTSATSSTASRSRDVHQLGDDRQPGLGLGLGEQPQALLAEPLEGVGGGARLVGAAAQQRRAGVAHDARGLHRLLARLDRAGPGDHREVLAADLAPGDVEHAALAVADLRGGELVRLEDRHDAVDAGLTLEAEARDVASCSTSPIAPITVTRAPWLRWARAPARSIFSTTASTSSSVAVSFITIIIDSSFQ